MCAVTAAMAYLVLGDSFVKRLCQCGRPLVVGGQEVQIVGFPGANLGRIRREIRRLVTWRSHSIVVLQTGSNDLCNSARTPELVADGIVSLATSLVCDCGIDKIVVCQITHRCHRRSESHLSGLTIGMYNAAVYRANALLKERCAGRIRYWEHHRNVRSFAHLSNDGVHLSAQGTKGFRRSIIGALSNVR